MERFLLKKTRMTVYGPVVSHWIQKEENGRIIGITPISKDEYERLKKGSV